MRISDWSSDVCSSDLDTDHNRADGGPPHPVNRKAMKTILYPVKQRGQERGLKTRENADANGGKQRPATLRSDEHTSELQSLMRISYAVFCLKKKKKQKIRQNNTDKNT